MANTKPFIPTCRYGHGEMLPLVNGISTDWYGIPSVDTRGVMNFSGVVMRLFKCQACSYSELHDVSQEEFDERVRLARAAASEESNKPQGGVDGNNS